MVHNILIATDFSSRSANAEARAAMLCRELGIPTATLCTVKEAGLAKAMAHLSEVSETQAQQLIIQQDMEELERRADQIEKDHGLRCDIRLRYGHPAQELAAQAEEMDADLIVLGAHGQSFVSRMFLGNTADKLVRLVKRPMLVVRNAPARAYRNILAPVDFSRDSQSAARLALQIAPQAALSFLHVYQVWYEGHMRYANVPDDTIHEYRIRARERAQTRLNQFVDDLDTSQRQVTRLLVHGGPTSTVLEFAQKNQPELIAMGKHGRSRFEELLLGSLTRDLLDQCASDMLIVTSEDSGGASDMDDTGFE